MSARDDLLESVITYAGAHGIAHASLRRIASGTGTSHRMLVHHFGSKEGVLVAVVAEVDHRQRRALEDLLSEGPVDLWAFWERFADPGLAPFERLYFELYGQALQGQSWAEPMLDGVVDDWLEPVTAALRTADERAGAVDARLAVAVTRGLLLDLLATGDHEAVREAMRHFMCTQYGGDSAG